MSKQAGAVLVGVLAAVCVLASCGRAEPGPKATSTSASRVGVTIFPVAQRKHLPDVAGRTLSGATLAVRSMVGQGVLVVNVWASWCIPCRGESPELASLAVSLRAQHVRFLGVDEQDTAAKGRSFAEKSGMTYPHLVDPTGTLLDKLKVLPSMGIPSTLIVDRRGLMAARIVGPTTGAQLRQVVEQVQRDR